MGSTVGDFAQRAANRVKERFNEDVEEARAAYKKWKRSPSWYQVTRHELGLDRQDNSKRSTGNRKASSQRNKSGR
jgi:hypothetical protein